MCLYLLPQPEAALLNKSLGLAAALVVTIFITIITIYMVKLMGISFNALSCTEGEGSVQLTSFVLTSLQELTIVLKLKFAFLQDRLP